ncbi:MAG: hypothetical protein WCP34_10265, partial [Pseudomonadota bacterium]
MSARCPVCGRAGLQSGAVECPQCNADLEAFQLLEGLEEVPPVPLVQTSVTTDEARGEGGGTALTAVHPPSASPVYLALLVLLAGLLLGAGFIFYLMPRPNTVVPIDSWVRIEPALQQVQRQIEEMQTDRAQGDEAIAQRLDERLVHIAGQLPMLARRDDLVVFDERLSLLEQRLRQWMEKPSIQPAAAPVRRHVSAVPKTPKTETVSGNETVRVHHLTGSDTLWNIAERCCGTGHLYPVLLVLNPGLGTRFPPSGKIRLPADQTAARRLLAESVVEQDGRRLLHYPIVAGDTWQKISQRLYGHAKLAAELDRLNGGRPPEPGASAWVP